MDPILSTFDDPRVPDTPLADPKKDETYDLQNALCSCVTNGSGLTTCTQVCLGSLIDESAPVSSTLGKD